MDEKNVASMIERLNSMIERLKRVEGKVFRIKGRIGFFKIEDGLVKCRLTSDGCFVFWHSIDVFEDFFTKDIEICDDVDFETGQPKPKPVDFTTALRDMMDNPEARYRRDEKICPLAVYLFKNGVFCYLFDDRVGICEFQVNDAISEKWFKIK